MGITHLRRTVVVPAVLLALLAALLIGPARPAEAAGTLRLGSTGPAVSELQQRLVWVGIPVAVTGVFGPKTEARVEHFQEKFGLPVSGVAGGLTQDRLRALTHNRYGFPMACRKGLVVCVDKTQKVVRLVRDRVPQLVMDARFGRPGAETREGKFSVYWKSRDHVSSIYNSPMPYAMFFSGGQAVHYSSDFAAVGYAGASHGCVNVRDRKRAARLFDATPVGTRLIVYRS